MQLIMALIYKSTTPVAGALAKVSWALKLPSRYSEVDTVIDPMMGEDTKHMEFSTRLDSHSAISVDICDVGNREPWK